MCMRRFCIAPPLSPRVWRTVVLRSCSSETPSGDTKCQDSTSSIGAADSTNYILDEVEDRKFRSNLKEFTRVDVYPRHYTPNVSLNANAVALMERWREKETPFDGAAKADNSTQTNEGAATSDVKSKWVDDVAAMYGASFQDNRMCDPNEDIDAKRRRLIYQSRYRGMVEMDLILGHFARCKLPTLEVVLLNEYDALLKQLDNNLFHWLVMGVAPPAEVDNMQCFHEIKKFVEVERKELLSSI